MEYLSFLWGYLLLVFWSWTGMIGTVLGLIEIGQWVSGRQLPQVPQRLIRVAALVMLVVASANAYSGLRDTKDKDIARLQQEVEDRAQRRAIRVRLSAFIASGEELKGAAAKTEDPAVLKKKANDWDAEVIAYLRQVLDESYVAAFKASGVAVGPPVPLPEYPRLVWMFAHSRVTNLQAITKSLL